VTKKPKPANDTEAEAERPRGVYFSFDIREMLRPGWPLKDPSAPPLTDEDNAGEMLVQHALRLADKAGGLTKQRDQKARAKRKRKKDK